MERLVGSAGFPWWWHTKDDTVDKIDADVLVLDTKVYLASVLRWLNAPVLPLDHARAAQSLITELERCRPRGSALRLSRCGDARAPRRAPAARGRAGRERRGRAVEAINRGLMRLSRVLVPLAYTSGDRFTHVCAADPPLAGLQPARELPRSIRHDAFKFARAALVRERNRAVHALDSAGLGGRRAGPNKELAMRPIFAHA
jgi:hypothetical protein